jgi:glycosyltransferase involved in cell wall biosynthesis
MSILTQACVRMEVIVCDDSASRDVSDLVKFLAKGYPQLRYVNGPRSGNPVENWNRGLDESVAKYCVVIHHDEFLVDSKYLCKALDKLEATSRPVVIGRCSVVAITRSSRFALVQRLMLVFNAPIWTLYIVNWIGSTAVVVFSRLNNLRFDANLVYLVDVDFYYRLLYSAQRVEFMEGISVVSLGHHTAQITAKCNVLEQSLKEARYISSLAHAKLSVFQGIFLIFFAWVRQQLSRRK